MRKGILPCFWRAPTDNDKGGGESSYYSLWKAAHIDSLAFLTKSCSIQSITDHHVKIQVVYEAGSLSDLEKPNALFEIDMVYTIYGSGNVVVECSVKPNNDLPPLPRIGVEFHLEESMDKIKWYGRGPFECYPDRKAAAHVGVYEQTVGDMHVPYIVPGECAGRTDVRWVTFQNEEGVGIYASTYGSSAPMQLNASYYTTTELDHATHNEQLRKGDTIEVIPLLFLLNKIISGATKIFCVKDDYPALVILSSYVCACSLYIMHQCISVFIHTITAC